jgi:hypothetical protein
MGARQRPVDVATAAGSAERDQTTSRERQQSRRKRCIAYDFHEINVAIGGYIFKRWSSGQGVLTISGLRISYRGCILTAPSRRMVSPFSMTFSMI